MASTCTLRVLYYGFFCSGPVSLTMPCMLAIRLLHGDDDPEILDNLLSNASNPTYEIVLEALKRRMLAMGADIPDRLRMWEPGEQ